MLLYTLGSRADRGMLTDTQSASVRSSVAERNAHDRDHYPPSKATASPATTASCSARLSPASTSCAISGAGIRNIVGGRSGGYEQELLQTRNEALRELEQRAASMGAHAVAWTWITRCWVKATMLMVTASGTAMVTLEQA